MTTEKDRILAVMSRYGMNQAQAAEYLGVPQGTLSNWISGGQNPTRAVSRLLDVLGTVEALAPGLHATMIPARKRAGRPGRAS